MASQLSPVHPREERKLQENTVFRFSTDDLPDKQRLPVWRENFCRTVLKTDVQQSDGLFQAELSLRVLPGLIVSWGSNSSLRMVRTHDLIDNDDDLFLVVPTRGRAVAGQLGREIVIDAGAAALGSSAHEGYIHNSEGFSHFTLKLPRRELEASVPNVERSIAQPLSGDSESLAMLVGYVGMLVAGQPLPTVRHQHLFATHVHDLLVLALGAGADAAQTARGRGLQAARLNAARIHILKNLAQPDLSVATVAASQKISPRYLQMLFEAEGTTFSEFVLKQRLACAHRMLTDPRLANRPIGVVALDAGFGDLSYFNLAFRRQYGGTPSDIRSRRTPSDA